jgi:RND family efflux transporter MFP subunit
MIFLYDHQSLPANDFKKIEAGYQAATQKYQMAREGTRGEEKEAASAELRAASAQMREAGKRLADCQLRAPIAGFVGMRRIDVGDTVAAGVPVIAVLDLNPAKVRVGIPEAEIGKVREGERATVTIPALGGRAFEGKVDAVGVAAEPASRTYTVKIAVPNPERVLKAGMVAEARIFSSQMVNVMTVPGSAIVHDGESPRYSSTSRRSRGFTRGAWKWARPSQTKWKFVAASPGTSRWWWPGSRTCARARR